ncbi:XdhC family protein [Nocardia sp. BMG51109]|uniref:XdhC family protein n=1 Tax=Nocardia sp. BMG51109 TaxID=1056816 RepID=UPI000464CF39|nr:XdhC family protein [Nocardia sp. BMG51109]
MRELGAELLRWHAANTVYALATIVSVSGSAPRPAGATMAVDEAGTVRGSLSGGCVEGAVYELCQEVLASGEPARRTFGFSADDAFAVGLTCGGELEVFVHRITSAQYPAIEAALDAEGPVAVVRDLESGELVTLGQGAVADAGFRTVADAGFRTAAGAEFRTAAGAEFGTVVGAEFDPAVMRHARAMLDLGATGLRVVGCADRERTVFVESFAPPPRMIVCGATDFATALCRVGRLLGYHVTVCEPRPAFADRARLPEADEVVRDWPHRYLAGTRVDGRTAICVLTHDPKFDIPMLTEALRLPVAYVGAMGSRRSDRERRRLLREAGLTEDELSRLHSPIGLELGGQTPEETAVAIGAEIVAVRRGGSTRPLSATDRPIHPVGEPPPTEQLAAG